MREQQQCSFEIGLTRQGGRCDEFAQRTPVTAGKTPRCSMDDRSPNPSFTRRGRQTTSSQARAAETGFCGAMFLFPVDSPDARCGCVPGRTVLAVLVGQGEAGYAGVDDAGALSQRIVFAHRPQSQGTVAVEQHPVAQSKPMQRNARHRKMRIRGRNKCQSGRLLS